MELDRDGPHRVVAVETPVDGGEAAVDGPQTADAGVVDAFDGADPELEVGADGVLYQHRYIPPAERVGDLLHGEWVGRRPRADPEQVHASAQGHIDVFARGDLRSGVHARFALDTLQPRDSCGSDPFETSGFRARFPESCTVDADALGGQCAGRFDHLFFGFGAARSCDDQRPAGIDPRECDGLDVVHGIVSFSVFQIFGLGHSAYSPRMRKPLVSGRTASTAWWKRSGSVNVTST